MHIAALIGPTSERQDQFDVTQAAMSNYSGAGEEKLIAEETITLIQTKKNPVVGVAGGLNTAIFLP